MESIHRTALAAPLFLAPTGAAQLLGVRPRTLDRWRSARTGPRYRRHGGRVVYAVVDLLAWSEAQASAPRPEPSEQRDAPA
jgi:hypothetical protein